MAVLTRDAILQTQDIKRELVHVPEWGGDVYVQMMTARDREAFEQDIQADDDNPGMDNVRAKMVARTVTDESGNRLFTEADVETLGGKSAAALGRLFDVAIRINAVSKADVEDLAKNSSTGQSDSSSTASPVTSDVPSTT